MELTIRSSSTDDHRDLLRVEIEPWGEELASADAIRAGFTRQPPRLFGTRDLRGMMCAILRRTLENVGECE